MLEQEESFLPTELQIDTAASSYLKDTAVWSRITGIAGFVLSALVLVFAYIYAEKNSRPSWYKSGGMSTDQLVALTMYIIIALLHAILSYLQFRFGNQLLAAIRNEDSMELNRCFRNIKVFSIMRGIIAILMVLLLSIAVIGLGNVAV